ncbi:TetR/AcrR family transcriptional regulator [Winogradskya humida]|uniref:HTH-type transcriptional regulator n=1 Tax=Winogradskya humida TaxID=113566 RepID=A0ABQ3ZGR8_9ACTN|nr:TetR/AcrR family transcriptional regulator [Actinoplanes humidus]GIE17452.1 putative HTH-type transcriptional regulator [Actinoplanes humidus]
MEPVRSPSRGPAREQAILNAAVELVAEIGYERVTVDAIAARARASKATMYRKWPGKAELVADALRRHAEGGVTELPDTGSLRGDLVAVVSAIAATFDGSDGGPSLLALVEAIRADPALRDIVRGQIDERSRQDGETICRRAVTRGEAVDEARGPTVVGLTVAHLFLRTMLGGAPPAPDEQQAFVDQILLPLFSKE